MSHFRFSTGFWSHSFLTNHRPLKVNCVEPSKYATRTLGQNEKDSGTVCYTAQCFCENYMKANLVGVIA